MLESQARAVCFGHGGHDDVEWQRVEVGVVGAECARLRRVVEIMSVGKS